ncbi:MAG: DUF4398 domain-containing protein [Xanthomonadaceae bacterium]|nr:DUF4398 domain-containing protein [Xanthomonadaceae bacterium]
MLLLAACATTPPPVDALRGAASMVQAAKDAQAPIYAPLELGAAEQRLDAAQAMMAAKKYDNAATLAGEAEAAAELARAKARLGQLRDAIRRRSADNAHLRKDLLERALPPPAAPAEPASAPPATDVLLPAPPASAPGATANGGDR